MKTLNILIKSLFVLSIIFSCQTSFAQDSDVSFENIDFAELNTTDDYSTLIAKVKKHRLALINELIISAEAFYQEGNYDKAAKVYEYIIEDNAISHLAEDIIEKGAESYYNAAQFSTAYEWYDELYKKKGDKMSSKSYENYTLSMLRLNSLVSTAVNTMIPSSKPTTPKKTAPIIKKKQIKAKTIVNNDTASYDSFVAGIIKNAKNNTELEEVSVALLDANGRVTQKTMTNLVGSFFFENVRSNANYTVKISKEKFVTKEITVALNSESMYEELDLTLSPTKEKKIKAEENFNLTPVVLFDYNNHKVSDNMAKELDGIVAIYNAHPNMKVGIATHTDARGSRAYNQRLSQKRAESIKDYLLDNGLSESNISHVSGFGEDILVNDCGNGKRCSKEMHQLNRRAEFTIVLN